MLDLSSQPPSYNSLSLQNVSQRSIVQSPDDHLVQSLPYLDTSTFRTKHYAGHLPASPDESDKQIFYWLFAPDFGNTNTLDSEEIPLILWLNGGPGCSSMIGLFIENGPFHFHVGENKKYNFEENAYSWHKAPAWVLYVDQPVRGTHEKANHLFFFIDLIFLLWMNVYVILCR
jgi:carboxypeptidase C (cathepsin A)